MMVSERRHHKDVKSEKIFELVKGLNLGVSSKVG